MNEIENKKMELQNLLSQFDQIVHMIKAVSDEIESLENQYQQVS